MFLFLTSFGFIVVAFFSPLFSCSFAHHVWFSLSLCSLSSFPFCPLSLTLSLSLWLEYTIIHLLWFSIHLPILSRCPLYFSFTFYFPPFNIISAYSLCSLLSSSSSSPPTFAPSLRLFYFTLIPDFILCLQSSLHANYPFIIIISYPFPLKIDDANPSIKNSL